MKKGEISAKMLVTIVLIIVGFIILILFFYNFPWKGTINQEVCHQSVVYRATLPSIGGVKEYIPLKCQTEKMCFSSKSGESCEEFENIKGITKVKVKSKEDIEKEISKKILNCWSVMGEGKLAVFTDSLATSYGIGKVGSSCVICNRIAFDRANLEKSGINIDSLNVRDYMLTHLIEGKNITYYEYLAGKGGTISIDESIEVLDIVENEQGNPIEGEKINLKVEQAVESSEVDELAIMFMQVSGPTHSSTLRNTAITLGLGFGGSYVITNGLITKITNPLVKSPVFWVLAIAGIAVQQSNVYYNKGITAGYCGDVSVGDEAREGCSVVRTVNYNEEDISKYCSIIESIP